MFAPFEKNAINRSDGYKSFNRVTIPTKTINTIDWNQNSARTGMFKLNGAHSKTPSFDLNKHVHNAHLRGKRIQDGPVIYAGTGLSFSFPQ